MATSIPISGLNQITNTITGSDFFPLVQSGSLTTFRTSISSLFALMAASASCSSSLQAISASYAKTASVAGTASFAQNAATSSTSVTASYALNAGSASNALSSTTSSFALNAASASFLTSGATTSASFATNAYTASNLYYNGVPNGTASYAINAGTSATASFVTSASYAKNADTASTTVSSSYSTTSSFALNAAGVGSFGLVITNRTNYAASTSNAWSRIDVTSKVSSAATFAYMWIMAWDHNNQQYVYVSSNHNTSPAIIATFYSTRLGSENGIPMSTVMFVPLATGLLYAGSKTFDIFLGNPSDGYAVTLQGYI